MKLISWNVNGIRAVMRKGFLEFLAKEDPEFLCLQETRAELNQFPLELRYHDSYQLYTATHDSSIGYSGVALLTKPAPQDFETGFGIERFDAEGRLQIAHYDDFVLFNVYFPNGKQSIERLRFKLDFYSTFLEKVKRELEQRKEVVVCGDMNTAHRVIDVARPKENSKISGFLPVERAWLDRFLEAGLIDTYRVFDPSPGKYTWWDIKTSARDRNVGWRLDYFFISEGLRDRLRSAFILSDVQGSDHCPIGIILDD
jgi:exodeoxyribonuclease-3